jgi:hypothetical protein
MEPLKAIMSTRAVCQLEAVDSLIRESIDQSGIQTAVRASSGKFVQKEFAV